MVACLRDKLVEENKRLYGELANLRAAAHKEAQRLEQQVDTQMKRLKN